LPGTGASHRWKQAQAAYNGTGSTAAANRQLNAAFYRIAITQARVHPAARAYLERKQAEGKSRREAIRCLKRQLARAVFNTLKASPALT
jgi:transposase